MLKKEGHDKRRCRYFAKKPDVSLQAPAGTDPSRWGIYTCALNQPPRTTTMSKCRYCRDNDGGYVPRESQLRVEAIQVGWYEENCYLLEDGPTGEMAVVDPGDEEGLLLARLGERVKRVRYILQTHGHQDHTGATGPIAEATGAPVLIGNEDALMLMLPLNLLGEPRRTIQPSLRLEGGESLPFGGAEIKVIATPGHTPGGLCFHIGRILFSGDTLFAGTVGRTDLPRSSPEAMARSLRELIRLPDDTAVYPGHGETTDIGREKRENPFLRL